MKSIIENAEYKAATAQLDELTTAQATAKLEESALLAQLDAHPEGKPSALDRAKAMLTGDAPAPRQDRDGLRVRLAACREKLALLGLAIQEQRDIMAGLMSAQSAIVNSEAKQPHIMAAERIKTALAGLRDAMQAEQSLRAEIVASGYKCSLEPMTRPDLNFEDSQSTIHQFERDVKAYLMLHEVSANKLLNVRLLFGTGADLPGDVLTMSGQEAAALIRIGHAEVTRDKPSRVKRPMRESYGQTMATALS